MSVHWFPMHHTLFMTFARALGSLTDTPYQGLILLDMLASTGALVSVWWMLRAMVTPAIAAAAALMLGVGPIFWGYGAMAGNYTAIVLVGSFLLGVAYRGMFHPRAWQPFASAIVLALGTGYRPDMGTLWLPVFAVVLWEHRWKSAIAALAVFTVGNLAWLLLMLHDVGGWARYREARRAEFAHQAGYLNSVWNLGLVDAPARYAAKLGMALVWTLGPALVFVPRGMWRLGRLGLKAGDESGSVMLGASSPSPALRPALSSVEGAPSPRRGEGKQSSATAAVESGRPLTRPSGTLSPAGRGRTGPRRFSKLGDREKLSPSPRRGEGWGEGAGACRQPGPDDRPSPSLGISLGDFRCACACVAPPGPFWRAGVLLSLRSGPPGPCWPQGRPRCQPPIRTRLAHASSVARLSLEACPHQTDLGRDRLGGNVLVLSDRLRPARCFAATSTSRFVALQGSACKRHCPRDRPPSGAWPIHGSSVF